MEDAEEKMAALKRAYADILLNMAKESAARIVASDRRALRFQQALFRAKEEAVATLLRVKGIMDSKVSEAQRLSLSQVRRIQELEIKLAEAEKTINYLKSELKTLNEEQSSIKDNQIEPLDKQGTAEAHVTFQGCVSRKAVSQKGENGQCYFSLKNVSHMEPSEDFTKKNFGHDPVLSSIILRSKEPELYRNGCTQRIRAFEQSALTRKAHHKQIDDQLPIKECITCEDEVMKESSITALPKISNVLTSSKDIDISKDANQHGGNCEGGRISFQGFSLQRKRTRIKRMNCSVPISSNQVETGHEPPGSPSCNDLGANGMSNHDKTVLLINSQIPQKMDVSPDPVSSGSSRDLEGDGSHSGSCINGKSPLKCQNSMPMEPYINSTWSASCDKNNPSSSTNVDGHKPDISDVLSEDSVRNNVNGFLAPHDETVINPRKTENLPDASISKIEPEKTGVDLITSHSINGKNDESRGTHSDGAGNNRLLKYTFRRKRKRGSSSCVVENVEPDKDKTTDERPEGIQSLLSEHQEATMLTGSSRDSRRIAQVARQLISLSEKRW